MEENDRCNSNDADEERLRRRLKRKGLDIKPFEIISCRRSTLMRSVEDPDLSEPLMDKDYLKFLNNLLFESEPSSCPIEGDDDDSDEEDELDPQYMMFLKNLKEDGRSYKLEIATKNRMVSVVYEGEDDSDDECGLQSLVKVKKILKRKDVESDKDPNMGHDRRRVRDDVMDVTLLKSEPAKCMRNNLISNRIGNRRSSRLCNNMMDSKKNLINNIERETTQKFEGDVKSKVAKDLKNLPKRMEVENHRSLRSGGRKHVEHTRMDMENNRGREAKVLKNLPIRMEVENHRSLRSRGRKHVEHTRMDMENNRGREAKDLKNLPIRMEMENHGSLRSGGRKHMEHTRMDVENNRGRGRGRGKDKSTEEKDFKSKRANHPQAKTYEHCGKKSRTKGEGLFGCDFHHELNDDDVDECYRFFLNSIKAENDYVLYAVKGQKPVKLEEFDVECSSDSEVLVTTNASDFNEGGGNPFQTTNLCVKPDNQLQCFGSPEGDIKSVFRKKLMAKLGEPYDDEEYKKLWNEINEERPKRKHIDLRGSGAMKEFAGSELSPSYLATYAPLKKKIVAVGLDRRRRLQFLRAFFFWLQNVAYDDAFKPWLDKSCLEMMRK